MNAQQIADFATRISDNMTDSEIHDFNRSVWYSRFSKTADNKLFDTYSAIVELMDAVESAVIVRKQALRRQAKSNHNFSKVA